MVVRERMEENIIVKMRRGKTDRWREELSYGKHLA